jgi:ABC-type lipoprotein export system ATPase subunit
MTALVDVRDLFAVYPSPEGGVAALQGLTLQVAEREVCVVLGPSGSGKSTLLRVLAGFLRPSAGGARVDSVDLGEASVARLARYRAEVLGYADQHYWRALAGELTAEELVAVPLGLAGVGPAERRARASELLERVGLLGKARARPSQLSGGEQQRVALCAALAPRPRLLIADEPTGELDAASADEVYALLAELVREHGATALVVSHDPRSTEIADRVVHIRDGRVSEERRHDVDAVVVQSGGWLRIPEETLRAAGIGDRAVVVPREAAIELRPAAGAPPLPGDGMPTRVSGRRGVLVEACGVTRRFGSETALESVDGVFQPGRLTVVTGPSGSGKSTLVALLAGLDLPDEGVVTAGVVELSSLDREARAAFRRESIAVVGQEPGLASFLTARENVELGMALRGFEPLERDERSVEALAAVGLVEHADRPVGKLSAGQRQRVALARAFAANPAVVVADEPTARLDAAATLAIGGLLAELAHDRGTTVVCATHDPLLVGLADAELRLGSRPVDRTRAVASATWPPVPRPSR